MRNILFSLSLILLISLSIEAIGQDLYRNYNVPVLHNGYQLKNAWAGGLNSAQFSAMDINWDGVEDLLVFDRSGDRLMIFINEGEGGYRFTRDYNNQFPSGLKNWVVARDFNCDGKMDLATNSQSGFIIYFNTGSVDVGLTWEQYLTPNPNNLVMASYAFSDTPFEAPVYTISIDMPSFVDYDDDGDIDVFTFTEFATTVYFFKNMSVENNSCDAPIYICANRCYGYFSEAVESFSMSLGSEAECQFNVLEPRSSGDRLHTGATILQLDLDQNGIKDMIVADVTESNMAYFRMEDAITGQDSAAYFGTDFPATFGDGPAIDLNLFPAGFYLDVDNDGVKDLLVSPNASTEVSDRGSVYFYKNNGLNDLPSFSFQQDNFLQSEMIELGTGAYPALVDIDGDGDLDLFVSNKKFYSSSGALTSQLFFYENVGTANYPTFNLVDPNYLMIPDRGWKSIYPNFADWDNDGDFDLLVGDQDGLIHLFINSGSANSPQFENPVEILNDANQVIDVGQFATPQLIDLDEDGLKDLVVGEKNGNINLYRNIGDETTNIFTLLEDSIGNVVASNVLGIEGYSVPYFFKNEGGTWELLLGSETGAINHYDQIEGNFLGDFNLITEEYQGINEGLKCAIAMGDITGDGIADLLYGNIGGGIALYLSEDIIINVDELFVSTFKIFPNPTTRGGDLILEFQNKGNVNEDVSIFDISGKKIWTQKATSSIVHIPCVFERGIYLIQAGNSVSKWIIE